MGGGGGNQKMFGFVHAQGIKTVHAEVGGQKRAKFWPLSCRMAHRSKKASDQTTF